MQVDVGLGVKIVGAFGGTYRVAAGLKLTACLRSEIILCADDHSVRDPEKDLDRAIDLGVI
jgi:hypothetical protein